MTKTHEINDLLLMYNKDYLSVLTSDEYKMGCTIVNCRTWLKQGKISPICSEISRRLKSLRVRKLSSKHLETCNIFQEKTCDRVAVYKVIFGKYDEITEPSYVDPQCDYYIITDNEISVNSVWKRIDSRYIDKVSRMNNYEKNRFFKMNPTVCFSEYKYSLYIDGNIDICGPVSDLMIYINPNTDMALHNMSNRDCIYDEVKACKLLKKGVVEKLDEQVERYRKEGFPAHFGMYECPIIIRKHSKKNEKIMGDWWKEYLKSARRDQISLPYIIWKSGRKFSDVGFIGNDVRNNPYFRQSEHNK